MEQSELTPGKFYKEVTDNRILLQFTGKYQEVNNMYETGKRPIFRRWYMNGAGKLEQLSNSAPATILYFKEYQF